MKQNPEYTFERCFYRCHYNAGALAEQDMNYPLNYWVWVFILQDHFITPSVFGEIIYNNFLFDIPKILDLCVLFGKGNGVLLQKMIG